MGNQSDKPKHKNALEIIKKMSVKSSKQFEEQFYKCSTNDIQQVSNPLHLSEKIKEYVNSQMIQTLKGFEKKYSLYREVRGDGNCFYRSVFYLYLEQLIIINQTSPEEVEKRIEQLRETAVDLDKLVLPSSIPLELEKFLYHITKFFNCGIYSIYLDIILNPKKLPLSQCIQQLQKFINTYPIFDFSSILIMRKIALLGYDKFKSQMELFYLGNELQIIKDYSIEGQNCIMKLISEYLQIPIQIENVQRDFVNTVEFIPEYTQLGDNQIRFPTLHLFFRPGHYDICYPIDYADEIYFRKKRSPLENNFNQTKVVVANRSSNRESKLELKRDYSINESCFFCKCSIHMLINLMKICQDCYNQKIGENHSNDQCKICYKKFEETARPYCLCEGCEKEYLDFGENATTIVKSSSINKSQEEQKQTTNTEKRNTPVNNIEKTDSQIQQNDENSSKIIVVAEQNKSKLINIKEQDDAYIIQPQNQADLLHNDFSDMNVPNHRQSTLLKENLDILSQYLLEEDVYINQSKSNSLRCVLCLNKINEFKQLNCKKHIICIQCSSNYQTLVGLCECEKQQQQKEQQDCTDPKQVQQNSQQIQLLQ